MRKDYNILSSHRASLHQLVRMSYFQQHFQQNLAETESAQHSKYTFSDFVCLIEWRIAQHNGQRIINKSLLGFKRTNKQSNKNKEDKAKQTNQHKQNPCNIIYFIYLYFILLPQNLCKLESRWPPALLMEVWLPLRRMTTT